MKLSGGNGKIQPKDCGSVNNKPIVQGERLTLVRDLFTFPSLHIMLGITNKLVQELEKKWPDFHKFAESLYIVREDYFGKQYEVNIVT